MTWQLLQAVKEFIILEIIICLDVKLSMPKRLEPPISHNTNSPKLIFKQFSKHAVTTISNRPCHEAVGTLFF